MKKSFVDGEMLSIFGVKVSVCKVVIEKFSSLPSRFFVFEGVRQCKLGSYFNLPLILTRYCLKMGDHGSSYFFIFYNGFLCSFCEIFEYRILQAFFPHYE